LDESQIDSVYSGLDQTIIIGEMEETTSIFDDLKISSSKKQETVTIAKQDL